MRLSGHVPDLPALEVLLTVARTGSLNSAGRELGVSQQAVSSRIRAIEAQTGVPLVSRTPRGSSLTDEGVVVAEWAARLLDVAAELDAGIAALRQDRHSRLRVSASLTVAEALLPGCLVAFRAAAARRPGQAAAEIVLTAAQTLMGVTLLLGLRFQRWAAWLLLGLFVVQFPLTSTEGRFAISAVYAAVALVALVSNRRQVLPTLAAPFAGRAKRHGGHPHQQPELVHES